MSISTELLKQEVSEAVFELGTAGKSYAMSVEFDIESLPDNPVMRKEVIKELVSPNLNLSPRDLEDSFEVYDDYKFNSLAPGKVGFYGFGKV